MNEDQKLEMEKEPSVKAAQQLNQKALLEAAKEAIELGLCDED